MVVIASIMQVVTYVHACLDLLEIFVKKIVSIINFKHLLSLQIITVPTTVITVPTTIITVSTTIITVPTTTADDANNVGLAVGLSVGLLVPLVIVTLVAIIVLVLVIVRHKRNKKESEQKYRDQEMKKVPENMYNQS